MAEAEADGRTLTPVDEEDGSAEAVGEMGFLSPTGNTKPRLLKYQGGFVQHIASGFDGRTRDLRIARLFGAELYLRRMPSDSNAASQQQLLVWGDDETVYR